MIIKNINKYYNGWTVCQKLCQNTTFMDSTECPDLWLSKEQTLVFNWPSKKKWQGIALFLAISFGSY